GGADDARPAGGSLQDDIPHGRPAGIRLLVSAGEAEDEEGRPGQSYFLQGPQCACRCAARFAGFDLPEYHHGAVCGSAAEYGARAELAGFGCYWNRRRLGLYADV